MGLALQRGNKVTLSYRKDAFTRIKDRNAKRNEECIRKGTIRALFSSNVVGITEGSVRLDVGRQVQEIPNDYVWIFAGGIPPNAFLKKVGIVLGQRDLTKDARNEAKQQALVAGPSGPA